MALSLAAAGVYTLSIVAYDPVPSVSNPSPRNGARRLPSGNVARILPTGNGRRTRGLISPPRVLRAS